MRKKACSTWLNMRLSLSMLAYVSLVCACGCVCVQAHTCGRDGRGGACRNRRSLTLRWAGLLTFIGRLRQKRALQTPWAETHMEPPNMPRPPEKWTREKNKVQTRWAEEEADTMMETQCWPRDHSTVWWRGKPQRRDGDGRQCAS